MRPPFQSNDRHISARHCLNLHIAAQERGRLGGWRGGGGGGKEGEASPPISLMTASSSTVYMYRSAGEGETERMAAQERGTVRNLAISVSDLEIFVSGDKFRIRSYRFSVSGTNIFLRLSI